MNLLIASSISTVSGLVSKTGIPPGVQDSKRIDQRTLIKHWYVLVCTRFMAVYGGILNFLLESCTPELWRYKKDYAVML
jgi:hypothetical protein